jgi:CubicO group peptidase (beta-lactamase class C family)
MEHNIFQILAKVIRLIPGLRNTTVLKAPAPFKGMKEIAFFNDTRVVMGETPSANTNASARGLAKVAAMMASGGQWGGREYLTEDAWKAMHAEPVEADMSFVSTNFTQGGVALFSESSGKLGKSEQGLNTGREGFYGWLGLGGSIFQWHPQSRIGFGYVPTSLNVFDFLNERGKSYQAEVLRCVERIRSNTAG